MLNQQKQKDHLAAEKEKAVAEMLMHKVIEKKKTTASTGPQVIQFISTHISHFAGGGVQLPVHCLLCM